MAKNVYFSGGTTSEQRLYEDLIIESLKIYGHDVYYLPREIVRRDSLFTEDVLSKFDENYLIEMYISNYEGFEGDGSLLTKFGVRIADEATFIISKRRWEDLISSSNNLVSSFRPNEGDVIYLPLTQQLFQIKFVEHEKPFRQLDAIQTYGLVAELMEYSDERLETGVDEIDKIRRDVGYSQVLKLANGGIADIIVTNGGTDYSSGTTITFIGSGANAVATPVITGGIISDILVTDPGQLFTSSDSVVFNNVGSGTSAAASIVVGNQNDFKFNEIVTGTKNTAKATSNISSGGVSSIVMTDFGIGYADVPLVTLSAPPSGGTQSTAVATLTNGKITGITVNTVGSGYTSSPIVTIAASPLDANGKVVRLDVTNSELELVDVIGNFADNDMIRGNESGAIWTINTFSSIENTNDPEAENNFFETQGDLIIDWTEVNPFGEYGDKGVF